MITQFYYDVGYTCKLCEVYDAARKYQEESLRLSEAQYTRRCSGVALTLYTIGTVLVQQGVYGEALMRLEESRDINEELYPGDSGNNTIIAAILFAEAQTTHAAMGQHEFAINLYEKTNNIYVTLFGDLHPNVAATLQAMGSVYLSFRTINAH